VVVSANQSPRAPVAAQHAGAVMTQAHRVWPACGRQHRYAQWMNRLELRGHTDAGDLYVSVGAEGELIGILTGTKSSGTSLHANGQEKGWFLWPSPADVVAGIDRLAAVRG